MNSIPSSSPVCVYGYLFLYVNNVNKGGGSRYKLPGLCIRKGARNPTMLHMFLSFQIESGKVRLSSVAWMALAAIDHLAYV